MENLEVLKVRELNTHELKLIQGNGWIADAIAWWFCGCGQTQHTHGQTYPR